MPKKERHRSSFPWYQKGLPLIASAFELLSSLPSSSAEDDIYYGRLSRDYQSRESARHSGADRSSDRRQSGATGYFYGQQPLVHTFETQGSCSRRCALPCVVQNVEDLMMPRWICPSQQSSELSSPNTIQHDTSSSSSFSIPFDNQFLLLFVPLALILFIILVIIWVRRSSSSSSSLNDDELV